MREDILVNGFVIMEDLLRIKVIYFDEVLFVFGFIWYYMSFFCLCFIYLVYNDGKNDLLVRCLFLVDLNVVEDGR